MPPHLTRILFSSIITLLLIAGAAAEPQTVYFRSADGRTDIVAYLFRPSSAGPAPAVVMLHGRGGPYSSNDNVGAQHDPSMSGRVRNGPTKEPEDGIRDRCDQNRDRSPER